MKRPQSGTTDKNDKFSRNPVSGRQSTLNTPAKSENDIVDGNNTQHLQDQLNALKATETYLASKTRALEDTVTALEKAKSELQESEERFRAALEANPDPVILYDMDGCVLFFNPAFTFIFGWSLEECRGRRMDRFVPEDAWTETQQMIDTILSGQNLTGTETTRYTKTGRRVPVVISGAVYRNKEGRPIGSVINLRDISEQKALQLQFQRSRRMEAIGTLAGGIAHDFNNILMGIQGRTSLMLLDIPSSHPNYEHLRGIETYVKSATALTQQLLGFARGGKYEVKATNLNAIIEKSVELFSRTKKELAIETGLSPDLESANVDRSQLEQVLLNLFINAWQAMPGGGVIRIVSRNCTLDEVIAARHQIPPGKYIQIQITDTGTGMPPEMLDRIFDPFFTTKGIGRGTGLGLASAYGIIHNHNGVIEVESDLGKGSTFSIYLPANDEPAAPDPPSEMHLEKGSGTILLVDDESLVIDVGIPLLENLGYTVLSANSGREALEIYKSRHDAINLVILDMIMPDMDGTETFDQLKAFDADVNVLLSSGYSLDEKASQILERGCRGFIQKPFNLQELSQKISALL